MQLSLPYPPSINRYWRRAGRHMHLSTEAKRYRQAVGKLLADEKIEPLAERLHVHLRVYPPDRRRRDLDNVQKPILDALEHGGAFLDDEQIDWLLTERCQVVPKGRIEVKVWPRRIRVPQEKQGTLVD